MLKYGICAALALGAVLGLAGVAMRQSLADSLWPESKIQRLLAEGEAALVAGRLTAADGSGAREKFEAAQALDSDRSEAREGLAQVASAALDHARTAIAEHRYADAHSALALARALHVPRAEADHIAAYLLELEAGEAGVGTLLERAHRALQDERLDGAPDAALPLYQQVLNYVPGLTEALEGREDALSAQLYKARQWIEEGDLVQGAQLIERSAGYDAGHFDLPGSRALLAQAVERKLRDADNALRRDPAQAAVLYRQIWEITGDVRASQGLAQVAGMLARDALRLGADFQFDAAEAALAQAEGYAPNSSAVAHAKGELQRIRRLQAHLSEPLTRPQRQRLRILLKELAQAQSRGEWMLPPGGSAYDKLRAAQALAPADATVIAADRQFRQASRDCFETELSRNRIRRAQACFEAWQAIAPNDSGVHDARERLAQRWLAIGDEQLGAGDIALARQALHAASALNPAAPGLEDFGNRVRSAQIVHD